MSSSVPLPDPVSIGISIEDATALTLQMLTVNPVAATQLGGIVANKGLAQNAIYTDGPVVTTVAPSVEVQSLFDFSATNLALMWNRDDLAGARLYFPDAEATWAIGTKFKALKTMFVRALRYQRDTIDPDIDFRVSLIRASTNAVLSSALINSSDAYVTDQYFRDWWEYTLPDPEGVQLLRDEYYYVMIKPKSGYSPFLTYGHTEYSLSAIELQEGLYYIDDPTDTDQLIPLGAPTRAVGYFNYQMTNGSINVLEVDNTVMFKADAETGNITSNGTLSTEGLQESSEAVVISKRFESTNAIVLKPTARKRQATLTLQQIDKYYATYIDGNQVIEASKAAEFIGGLTIYSPLNLADEYDNPTYVTMLQGDLTSRQNPFIDEAFSNDATFRLQCYVFKLKQNQTCSSILFPHFDPLTMLNEFLPLSIYLYDVDVVPHRLIRKWVYDPDDPLWTPYNAILDQFTATFLLTANVRYAFIHSSALDTWRYANATIREEIGYLADDNGATFHYEGGFALAGGEGGATQHTVPVDKFYTLMDTFDSVEHSFLADGSTYFAENDIFAAEGPMISASIIFAKRDVDKVLDVRDGYFETNAVSNHLKSHLFSSNDENEALDADLFTTPTVVNAVTESDILHKYAAMNFGDFAIVSQNIHHTVMGKLYGTGYATDTTKDNFYLQVFPAKYPIIITHVGLKITTTATAVVRAAIYDVSGKGRHVTNESRVFFEALVSSFVSAPDANGFIWIKLPKPEVISINSRFDILNNKFLMVSYHSAGTGYTYEYNGAVPTVFHANSIDEKIRQLYWRQDWDGTEKTDQMFAPLDAGYATPLTQNGMQRVASRFVVDIRYNTTTVDLEQFPEAKMDFRVSQGITNIKRIASSDPANFSLYAIGNGVAQTFNAQKVDVVTSITNYEIVAVELTARRLLNFTNADLLLTECKYVGTSPATVRVKASLSISSVLPQTFVIMIFNSGSGAIIPDSIRRFSVETAGYVLVTTETIIEDLATDSVLTLQMANLSGTDDCLISDISYTCEDAYL